MSNTEKQKSKIMEKQKIWVDRNREANFLISLQDVKERSNELITQYNSLQNWEKINTLENWLDLVSDPEAYFDRALHENIKVEGTGGKLPNAEKLAELFDIPREAFMNIVQGVSFNIEGCKPCKAQRLKIRKGKHCITLSEFTSYQNFLLFSPEGFTQDENKVKEGLKTFEKYTENSQELELYNYWVSIVDLLNSQVKKGYWGPQKLQEGCKLFGLKYADNRAYPDEEFIYHEILKMRK